MQALPDPGLLQLLEIVVTRTAAAQAQFSRQIVPSDAGFENEQDAGKHLAAVQGLTAGETKAAWFGSGQEGLDFLP
jgi:hypothetical protein